MAETVNAKAVRPCRVRDLFQRFRPVCDHLAAAHREVLLAARSAIDTQVELIEEWRARHAKPGSTTRVDVG